MTLKAWFYSYCMVLILDCPRKDFTTKRWKLPYCLDEIRTILKISSEIKLAFPCRSIREKSISDDKGMKRPAFLEWRYCCINKSICKNVTQKFTRRKRKRKRGTLILNTSADETFSLIFLCWSTYHLFSLRIIITKRCRQLQECFTNDMFWVLTIYWLHVIKYVNVKKTHLVYWCASSISILPKGSGI